MNIFRLNVIFSHMGCELVNQVMCQNLMLLQGGESIRIVGSGWHWSMMFHHLAQLLGQFCQFPISPSKTRQRVEQPKSKSTQPNYPTRCTSQYLKMGNSNNKVNLRAKIHEELPCQQHDVPRWSLSLLLPRPRCGRHRHLARIWTEDW